IGLDGPDGLRGIRRPVVRTVTSDGASRGREPPAQPPALAPPPTRPAPPPAAPLTRSAPPAGPSRSTPPPPCRPAPPSRPPPTRREKEGPAPSPAAGRARLLRRVYLDLVGLPPTVAQVGAFLDDPRPDAYERVVDGLLASPHYGERWARPWLDLARYADSNGFEKDLPRVMWKYRDWVINALNQDMPFDRFTIDQIAGDMLPNPTVDQLIASGFHRTAM